MQGQYVRSKELRLYLSKKTKAHLDKFGHPMLGKKRGETPLNVREKISASMKGKKNSLGFKHTDQTKINMGISKIGNCNVGRGEDHPKWKGGRIEMDKRGYILVYSPNHPFKTKKGYVSEHRLIAEKKIGRFLWPFEVAHHINGKKDDNRPENLEVMSASEHTSHHRKCRLAQA